MAKPKNPDKTPRVSNAFDMTGFEIFRPFQDVKPKSTVIITTWGLGSTSQLEPIITPLVKNKVKVHMLVGYSKATHSQSPLMQNILDFRSLGWKIKVLPSFHAKIWIINDKAWVGSANFVRGTITNFMVQTTIDTVADFFTLNWEQAYDVSDSTDLDLVPQAKQKLCV